MLLATPVPVPFAPGKLVFRSQKKFVYVIFEVNRIYKPEKKYNIPIHKLIGRLVNNDDRTMMYPNENFSKFFPQEAEVLEAQKKSALEGDSSHELREDDGRSCCLKIGGQMVIQQIATNTGVKNILEKHLGDDAGLCLDLMSYLIINEDNAGQYYPNFAYNHPLATEGMRIYSDSKVSSFLKSVTQEQIIGILEDWNAIQDHKSRIYISYDSTNKNSQAGEVNIVEFGKAKDNKDLPIFNVSVAYDQNNQVPLFYEQYPGSINDVSQLKYMVDKAIEYKYKSIGFILDRGYFSKENIRYMDEKGFSFLMMVKGCKSLVSSLIDEFHGTFEADWENVIPHYGIYGKTIKRKMFLEDTKERYFHIFCNPARMAIESKQLIMKIEKLSAILKSLEGKKVELGDLYTKYFDCFFDKNKIFLFAKEKKDVIKQELRRCGYFCLVSSDKMDAQEAYQFYKGRDASEKLFRADKSFLGSKPMRVHSSQSIATKILIEFMALIVRNRIYTLLKTEMFKTLGSRKNFMTVPAALNELEKIEMVRINDSYLLDHAVTKTQQTILKAFGISKENVVEYSRKISDILKASKSARVSNQEKENDEVEDLDELAELAEMAEL